MVIPHETAPLPADVARTKLNFTEFPRANVPWATPVALFTVAAVVLSVDWLKVNVTPGVTVNEVIPTLPLESVAVT